MACGLVSITCLVFLILPSGVSQRAGHYKVNFSVYQGCIVSIGLHVQNHYPGRILSICVDCFDCCCFCGYTYP